MSELKTKKRNIEISFDKNRKRFMSIDVPVICPVCGFSHSPEFLNNFYCNHENGIIINAFFLCPNCGSTYCVNYLISSCHFDALETYPTIFQFAELKGVTPNESVLKSFTFQDVVDISRRANEVYKQSQKAENLNLNEISGMGYRKTLEILVKDYLIYLSPEQSENIKKYSITTAIDKLDDENLKILATRCTWLGNDESHYLKKHDNYDIVTLKELLEGIITYIHLKLLVNKAEDIQPK